MVKALGLIGITAALLISQGCGGKKNEVASVPPAASSPSPPSSPSMESGDGSSGQSNSQSSGGSEDSSMSSEGGPGGMPSMASMPGMSGRPSMGSGGSSGNEMENEGSSGYGNNGQNQGFQNGQGQPGNNQPGAGRGPARPRRIVPPPTLKEQAVNAFQVGNPKRAFTLMEAYALMGSDEEAADVLKHYRWASQRKRPQLGLNIAVGVTVKNPTGMTDLSPIGAPSQGNGGGGFGGSGGGGESGMGGAPANSGNGKSLAETTGEFGKQLVAAFKEKHESGAWSPAFSEYSLATQRTGVNAGGSGAFDEGFSGGNGDFGFTDGNQSGFSDGMQSEPGMGQFGNNGGEEMNSGQMGNSGGNAMNSGQRGSSGGNAMNSGQMGSSGGNAMNSGGMGAPGSSGLGTPPQFQGKGGMSADGMEMGGPMGNGPMGNGPMGNGPMGNGPMGNGPMGNGPMGNGPMGNGPNMGGAPNMGGRGMGMPPAFAANMKLPSGSSPLAPCLTFIGVDETSKLMKKASQEGYDGLMLFEVTIGYNRALQKVTNDTLVRVVQPNAVAKDVKRVYVSRSLNNLQYLRSKAKGESDGLEDTIQKIVRETEEGLAIQPLPAALTPDVIATKRIPSLVKETESSVLDRLSEVNLYYFKGFIDENQKADAFEQIAGPAGRVIATGSSSERLAAIEKLLEREFK